MEWAREVPCSLVGWVLQLHKATSLLCGEAQETQADRKDRHTEGREERPRGPSESSVLVPMSTGARGMLQPSSFQGASLYSASPLY